MHPHKRNIFVHSIARAAVQVLGALQIMQQGSRILGSCIAGLPFCRDTAQPVRDLIRHIAVPVVHFDMRGILELVEDSDAAQLLVFAEQPQDEYDAMCRRVREVAKQFDYKVLAAREMELLG